MQHSQRWYKVMVSWASYNLNGYVVNLTLRMHEEVGKVVLGYQTLSNPLRIIYLSGAAG